MNCLQSTRSCISLWALHLYTLHGPLVRYSSSAHHVCGHRAYVVLGRPLSSSLLNRFFARSFFRYTTRKDSNMGQLGTLHVFENILEVIKAFGKRPDYWHSFTAFGKLLMDLSTQSIESRAKLKNSIWGTYTGCSIHYWLSDSKYCLDLKLKTFLQFISSQLQEYPGLRIESSIAVI